VTDTAHPRDALLDLVYGELPADQARAVQRHVDGCAACAETVAGYRAVRGAARALPREAQGTAGLESLLHHGALAAGRARRRRVLRWAWPLAAATVAVWVGVVAVRPPAPAPGSLGELAKAKAAAEPAGEAKKSLPGELLGRAESPKSAPAASPSPAPAAPAQRQVASQLRAKDVPRDEGSVRMDDARAAVAEREAARPLSSEAPAPAAKRVAAPPAALGGAAGASAAGAPAKADKLAAPPSAEERRAEVAAPAPPRKMAAAASEQDAVSNLAATGKLSAPVPDAGLGQRGVDEARRAWLIARLQETKGAAALPLLAELCALEVRLGHREDAVRVCGQVARDFPGTPEAAAAGQKLEHLPPP